ncbi:acyltransferase 3 [Terriglobus saanensis SP1PR4]|uniref:Acyltransferase 3 n=2 Tax=Terriglobus saanensis TaxID=870903 RepID=E8V7R7_TERSS|nr:acyltransferase 3 [Terriglobus saanensis SP1PR4]
MIHHDAWTGNFSLQAFKIRTAWGLELFFAISGFLICSRILGEEEKFATFKIASFYIRRFFRIQPAACAYLGVVGLLMVGGVVMESPKFWIGALFGYQNFLYNSHVSARENIRTLLTGHFWTLAVEEHFYILISATLFFFKRRRILVLASLWFSSVILNRLLVNVCHIDLASRFRMTNVVLPYLLFAALAAALLQNKKNLETVKAYLSPWITVLITVLLVSLRTVNQPSGLFTTDTLDRSEKYIFYCFTLWIVSTVTHPRSLSTRFLENRAIRYVGRLSYSLYLWHVLFFLPARPEMGITWHPLVIMSSFPLRYLFTLIAALVSYYVVERPMIRIGHRLADRFQLRSSSVSPQNALILKQGPT